MLAARLAPGGVLPGLDELLEIGRLDPLDALAPPPRLDRDDWEPLVGNQAINGPPANAKGLGGVLNSQQRREGDAEEAELFGNRVELTGNRRRRRVCLVFLWVRVRHPISVVSRSDFTFSRFDKHRA